MSLVLAVEQNGGKTRLHSVSSTISSALWTGCKSQLCDQHGMSCPYALVVIRHRGELAMQIASVIKEVTSDQRGVSSRGGEVLWRDV